MSRHAAALSLTPRVLFRCCSVFSRLSTATSFEVYGLAPDNSVGEKGTANESLRTASRKVRPQPQQQDRQPSQRGGENAVVNGLPFSQKPQHVSPQSGQVRQRQGHLQWQERNIGGQPAQLKHGSQRLQGSASLQKQQFSRQCGLQQAPKQLLPQPRPASAQPQQLPHVHEEARLRQQPSLPPARSHYPVRLLKPEDMEKKIKKMQPWQRMLHWQQEWLKQKRWMQKCRRQQEVQGGHFIRHRQLRQHSSKRVTPLVALLQQERQVKQPENSFEDGQPRVSCLHRSSCNLPGERVVPLSPKKEGTVQSHGLQQRQSPQRAHRYVQTAPSPVQKLKHLSTAEPDEGQCHQNCQESQGDRQSDLAQKPHNQRCVGLQRQQHVSLTRQQHQWERETQVLQQESSSPRMPHRSPDVCGSMSSERPLNVTSEQVPPDRDGPTASEVDERAFSQKATKSSSQQSGKVEGGACAHQRAAATDTHVLTSAGKNTSCPDADAAEEEAQNRTPLWIASNVPEVSLQTSAAEQRFALPDGAPRQILLRPPLGSSTAPTAKAAKAAAEKASLSPSAAQPGPVSGRGQETGAQREAGTTLSPREPSTRHAGPQCEPSVDAEQREEHGQQADAQVAAKGKEQAESKQQCHQHWQGLRHNREDQRQLFDFWRGNQDDRPALPGIRTRHKSTETPPYMCPLTGRLGAVSAIAARLRDMRSPSATFFDSTHGNNAAAAAALRDAEQVLKCARGFEGTRGWAAVEELLDSTLRGRLNLFGYPARTVQISSSSRGGKSQPEGGKIPLDAATTDREGGSLGTERDGGGVAYNRRKDKQNGVRHDYVRSSCNLSRKCSTPELMQGKERRRASCESRRSAKSMTKKGLLCCPSHHSSCCRCRRHLRVASNRGSVGTRASELAAAPSNDFRADHQKLPHGAQHMRACRARRHCGRRRSHRRHHSSYKQARHRTCSRGKNGARRSCCCCSRKAARSRQRRLYRGLMHVLQLASRVKKSTGSPASFAPQVGRSSDVCSLPPQQIVTQEDSEQERAEVETALAAALVNVSGLDTQRSFSADSQKPTTAQQLRLFLLLPSEQKEASITGEDRAAKPASLQDQACSMQSSNNARRINRNQSMPLHSRVAKLMVDNTLESQGLPQGEVVSSWGLEQNLTQHSEAAEEVVKVLQSASLTDASSEPIEAQLLKENQQAITEKRLQEDSLLHTQERSCSRFQPHQESLQQDANQQLDKKDANKQQERQRQVGHTTEILQQFEEEEEEEEEEEGDSSDISEKDRKSQGGASAASVARPCQGELATSRVASAKVRRPAAHGISPRAKRASERELCGSKTDHLSEFPEKPQILEDNHSPSQRQLPQEAEEVRVERHQCNSATPRPPGRVVEQRDEDSKTDSLEVLETERHESQAHLEALKLKAALPSEKEKKDHSLVKGHSQKRLNTHNVFSSGSMHEESRLSQQERGRPQQTKHSRPEGRSESQHLESTLLPEGRERQQQKGELQEKLPSQAGMEVMVGQEKVEESRQDARETCAVNTLNASPPDGSDSAFDELQVEILNYRKRFTDRLLQREPLLRLKLQEHCDLHSRSQSKRLHTRVERNDELSCPRRGTSASRAGSQAEAQEVSSRRCLHAREESCGGKELKDQLKDQDEEAVTGKEGTNNEPEYDARQLHAVLQAYGSWAVSASVAEEFLQESFEEAVEQIEESLAAAVEDLLEQEQRTLLAIGNAKSTAAAALTTCC